MNTESTGTHLFSLIKPRPEDGNKYTFGTLLMLVGSEDMPGAGVLASLGALRSGVGVLCITGRKSVTDIISKSVPEAVCEPFGKQEGKRRHSAFLCGCGLGRTYDEDLEDILTSITLPSVFDADCINYFSKHKDILGRIKCEYIITPHSAEMSRLTGKSIAEIESSREETALSFARDHSCVVLLKGKNTVIASHDGRICINISGNTALSKGGSGDVLTGVIGSLLAQGYCTYDAARLGAYLHGVAAEELSKKLGVHGVIPSDLPAEIGRLMG